MCKIYTILISEKDIEDTVKAFQKNMRTALKKEWYITFHTSENVIVVFRKRIFALSGKGITPVYQKCIDTSHAEDMILSRLVDTFFSRISLTMPPGLKSHNTACVLS